MLKWPRYYGNVLFLQVFSESKLIRVAVQLGAVKIYVAALEALKKKERQDETQFTTKIDGFLSFIPG